MKEIYQSQGMYTQLIVYLVLCCVHVFSAAAAILTASSRQTGIVLDMGNSSSITAICHGADVSGAFYGTFFGNNEAV